MVMKGNNMSGFSPLADMRYDIPAGDRYSRRNSPISGFTIHHNAGVNAYGEATNPNREVSANYWISNEGIIMPHIEEEFRAFTTGANGYPAGAASDHRNITVEVSNSPEGVANGTWAISAAAYKALCMLIGDVFKRNNLGPVRRATTGGVAVHQDFVPTACPGPYIMSHLGQIIADAEAYRQSGSTPGTNPAPNPVGPSGSITELAQQVLAGVYGNGAQRKAALGSKYDAVQAEVNRLLGITTSGGSSKSISQLADEVMRGEHGNGQDRVNSLGSSYDAVQAEVNRRLYGGANNSSNISALADAVMRGEYGNGADRVNALGSNYAAVQDEVNRRLYG